MNATDRMSSGQIFVPVVHISFSASRKQLERLKTAVAVLSFTSGRRVEL